MRGESPCVPACSTGMAGASWKPCHLLATYSMLLCASSVGVSGLVFFFPFSKVYLLFHCSNLLHVVNSRFCCLGITGAHSLKASVILTEVGTGEESFCARDGPIPPELADLISNC